MTNPSNAVGTNGAYGGRTSVDALNDVLGAFNGAGVLSGWNVRADSGMSVLVGGQSGVRDVAVAQDQLGDRTTVNNRLGSPISITLASSSPSTARVDSIVLYVNKPASVSTTTIDNPEACGIIAVNGTTVAPSSADIRSAISADGGTGATAYYVVIANITIPASATVITNTNISNYSGNLLAGSSLADSTITAGKIDWTTITADVRVVASILGRGNLNIVWDSNLNNIGTMFGSSYGDGYYAFNSWSGSSAGTGQPSERVIGMMLVQSSTAWSCCTQTIFASGTIYTRRYASGSWGHWFKIQGTDMGS